MMTAAYLDALRDFGETLITHIGLVNDLGDELTGGTPAYGRLAVTWVDDGTGIMRPSTNLSFDIPAGATVAGWRGYDASIDPSTDFGGADLTPEVFAGQGTYTLLAASTGVRHEAA
jgi:hypothetical protein